MAEKDDDKKPFWEEILRDFDSYAAHQKQLFRDIKRRKEDLEKERPFLLPEEIKHDVERIAALEEEVKQDRATYEALEARQYGGDWEAACYDRWCRNYDETRKGWCRYSRATVDRAYRVRKGLGYLKHAKATCPRCERCYEDKQYGGAHMMAACVEYYFPDNVWFVDVGYGSIISDGDLFVVKKPYKMGSLLRQGLVVCDFCLVDLVEDETLAVVYMMHEVVVNRDLYNKFRSK